MRPRLLSLVVRHQTNDIAMSVASVERAQSAEPNSMSLIQSTLFN